MHTTPPAVSGLLAIVPGGGKAVNVLGANIRIKLHGRQTGGAFALLEASHAPGEGLPAHRHHREDETFYVLEGRYEFHAHGTAIPAEAGTVIVAPRGVAHSYRNVGATVGRLLIVVQPAGCEHFFEEVGALRPSDQVHLPRVTALADKYGIHFLPHNH